MSGLKVAHNTGWGVVSQLLAVGTCQTTALFRVSVKGPGKASPAGRGDTQTTKAQLT